MDDLLGSLSRRTALCRLGRLAALVAGGLGLTWAVPTLAASVAAMQTTAPVPPPPEPQLREFVLTASELAWDLMADTTVQAWGYNGQVPGPELRVREGDQVRVTLRNQLPVPTTIHWHGVAVPPAMDGPAGLNQAPVAPGEAFVYDFVAMPAGSRWYHSHADPALQVPLGLYGPLIIEPRDAGPRYDREYTIVLAEWDLELTPAVAAGTSPRGPGDRTLRGGALGSDFFLMNGHMHGAIPPLIVAEGERILIRLMHAGAEPHAFHIHGHSFNVVATDGFPVPEVAQVTKDTLLIGPGERYDLELFANNPGVWMVHCHMEPHMANGMMTLLAYEGAVPTGPAAAFYDPSTAGISGDQAMAKAIPMPAMTSPPPAVSEPVTESGPLTAVAMLDDRFAPNDITIATGTTVRWINRGQNWHSVAAFDGSFSSERIEPGGHFDHHFAAPGVFQYLCKHHVLQGMTGRVTVNR